MTDAAPTLTILIVSYNTAAMTRACLDSIAEGARATRFEIIIVDNASSDGSAAMIAAHPIGARLIAAAENIGFGRANNLGAAAARGEYLLLLNPDTLVQPGAIDRLLEFAAARPQAGIWGGRTIFADGRLNPSSAWARMTLWGLFCRATGVAALAPQSPRFNPEAYGGWARDSVREVDIVSGCFLLTTLSLWRRLGGFDPVFYMYGEEADLCLRARALGIRPSVTPDATIVHHGGASEATRAGKMVKLLAAKATLIRRHFAPGRAGLALALLAAWPLARLLAHALAGRLLAREASRREADVWRRVLAARREWLPGYGPCADLDHARAPVTIAGAAEGSQLPAWSAFPR